MTCPPADDDCPNCGLSNIDVGSPDYPFCDRLCAVRYEERRALRRLRIELFWWNLRSWRPQTIAANVRQRWSSLLHRVH